METEGLLLAQVALAVEVQDRIAPFPSNRLRKLSKAVRKNRPVRFVGWRLANCWQLSTLRPVRSLGYPEQTIAAFLLKQSHRRFDRNRHLARTPRQSRKRCSVSCEARSSSTWRSGLRPGKAYLCGTRRKLQLAVQKLAGGASRTHQECIRNS